ncbi:MAG: hypothetical protein ACFFE8_11125 [Candidatus Heimdallarchaeota archaeon]
MTLDSLSLMCINVRPSGPQSLPMDQQKVCREQVYDEIPETLAQWGELPILQFALVQRSE